MKKETMERRIRSLEQELATLAGQVIELTRRFTSYVVFDIREEGKPPTI